MENKKQYTRLSNDMCTTGAIPISYLKEWLEGKSLKGFTHVSFGYEKRGDGEITQDLFALKI